LFRLGRRRSAKPSGGGFDSRTSLSKTFASFGYRHRPPRSQCGKAGSTPARGTRSRFTGCSSAWTRARAWGARGRWFESSHPDFFLWVWLSLVERTVRIREVAGSSPATQTRSSSGHGPMVGLSSDTRAVLVRFQVPRLPSSALGCSLPPWRRWFARLSEKQEDLVRFQETALLLHRLWVALREQLGLQIRAAGFNSLATCHALVAQLEEHRFRKPGVVGSNPTGGTRSTEVSFAAVAER
jgi:hypothetical protein